MIELTLEQVRALARAGDSPTAVIDPTTRQVYALIPAEVVFAGGGYCSMSGSGGSTHSISVTGPESEGPQETSVEPWKHLVIRKHPWRKQLYLKGRNMTVRQLVGTMKASRFTEEEAANDVHLPVDAVREALAYFEANPEVIDLDAAHERYLDKLRGRGRGPESVPR